MRIFKSSNYQILKLVSFGITWSQPSEEPILYLTFDDGPIPEVTPWVVETLKKYNARATFFCVGENAKKYPALISLLRNEGHSIGTRGHHAVARMAHGGEARDLVDELHDDAPVHEAGRVRVGRAHPVHEHAPRIGDGVRFHEALR